MNAVRYLRCSRKAHPLSLTRVKCRLAKWRIITLRIHVTVRLGNQRVRRPTWRHMYAGPSVWRVLSVYRCLCIDSPLNPLLFGTCDGFFLKRCSERDDKNCRGCRFPWQRQLRGFMLMWQLCRGRCQRGQVLIKREVHWQVLDYSPTVHLYMTILACLFLLLVFWGDWKRKRWMQG